MCACMHGTVQVGKNTRSCVKPPERLFGDQYFSVHMTSNASLGQTVLTGELKTLIGVNFTKKIELFPKHSFLEIDDGRSNDNKFVLYLVETLALVNTDYEFTIYAQVMYTENDNIISVVSDITQLIISVTRIFENPPPVRGVFVMNGTRKDAIVFDLTTVLGTVENLRLVLKSAFTNHPFRLSNHLIVCQADVQLYDLVSASNIGTTVILNVTTPTETILILKIAIIVDSFRKQIKETESPSVRVADFSSLTGHFAVKLFTAGVATDFMIPSSTGDFIQLRKVPNYEIPWQRRLFFALNIAFRDEVTLQTTVYAEMEVVNVDDETPVFGKMNYNFVIYQGINIGSIVGLLDFTDPDSDPGQLVYTIRDPFYSSYFKDSDPPKGALILQKRLNSTASFMVTVSDGNNTSTLPAMVNITVVRLNPELQFVGESQNISLPEEMGAGQYVTNVTLTNYTGYQLLIPSEFFSVDHLSGAVTTSKTIDREMLTENPIILVAVGYPEDESCNFYMVGNVTINILDVNDNDPVFSKPSGYSATILEHSQSGSVVIQITATDKDLGENASLRYYLLGPNNQTFQITKDTGVITVAESTTLDREQTDMMQLGVTVTDGGDTLDPLNRRTASTTVNVTLSDQNDNSPVFPQHPYFVSVTENNGSQPVLTLTASDADTGANGEVSYILLQGGLGYFALNRRSGELSTTRSLDREEVSNFSLTVLAFDGGSPISSATTTIIIGVLDVNDMAPVFQNSNNHVAIRVEEGTSCVTTPILNMSATDNDAGINSEILYSLDSDLLHVDNATGQIFCLPAGLDFENVTQQDFSVVVIATDKGTPPLNDTTSVQVLVQDLNDNSPVFTKSHYNFTVDNQVGQIVGLVFAHDRDTGEQGEVNYTIASSNTSTTDGLLSVDGQGLIRVVNKTSITNNPYVYTVTATDKGSPPQSNQSTVVVTYHIQVTQKLFSDSEFVFKAVENTNYSQNVIGTLNASVTPIPLFFLDNVVPNNDPGFRVKTTGEVNCDVSLDRELFGNFRDVIAYTLYIKANSSAGTDFAAVRIQIVDLNDNSPEFGARQEQLYFRVEENKPNGTVIVDIIASDPDSGPNGTVIYSIANASVPFSIDRETGSLSVRGQLDRERTPDYTLTVVIRDDAVIWKTATTTVRITLDDVNDNPPQFFNNTPINMSIAEDALTGHSVGQLLATDADFGTFGRVSYGIVNVGHCPLAIDAVAVGDETAAILSLKANQSLDFEGNITSYVCIVSAIDKGSEPLSSSLNVTIIITDVNDNCPRFHNVSTNITVSRDAIPGDVIVQKLTATDADSGIRSSLTFYLVSNGADQSNAYTQYFTIVPASGQISVQSALRDFKEQMISLDIGVKDGGQPPCSETTTIYMQINDSNTTPQFTETEYLLNLTEEEVPDTTAPLVIVSAFDYDNEGKKGQCNCTFSLQNAPESKVKLDEYFAVNNESGDVTQEKQIDRETTGDFILGFVVVTDKGIPPKSATAQLNISVQDINDNYPQFRSSNVTVILNESTCNTSDVINTLDAVDEDNPPNNVIEYSLLQLGTPSVDVNRMTGELRLTSPLCSQSPVQFWLAVTARDPDAKRSQMDVVAIFFTYERNETNVHTPAFTKASYHVKLPYMSAVETAIPVPDFLAADEDNDTITYSILQGNFRDLFRLNNQTGMMTLQYQLDQSVPALINVTILAVDSGHPPRTGTTTVSVTVAVDKETAETCNPDSMTSDLLSQKNQLVIFRGLFAAVVSLLAVVILFAVVIFYRLRVRMAEEGRRRQSEADRSTPRPLDQPLSQVTGWTEVKSVTSGFPPELPRRPAEDFDPTSIDSANYLDVLSYETAVVTAAGNDGMSGQGGERASYLHAVAGSEEGQDGALLGENGHPGDVLTSFRHSGTTEALTNAGRYSPTAHHPEFPSAPDWVHTHPAFDNSNPVTRADSPLIDYPN